MVALPDQDRVAEAIYKLYEDREAVTEPRGYLGGSSLGEECERMLWYRFRHCKRETFPGRVLRLFETGHREEARVIDNLRAIGITVYDLDDDGKQYGFERGHLAGHSDGVLVGVLGAEKTPHLYECKTHNEKSFADLKKHGVEKSKPVHGAQMQLYMGELELTRALYVAVCKDTDEIYTERLRYDKAAHRALLKKAERIIKSPSPLSRMSEDPTFYKCKWCDYWDLCHDEKPAAVNCRTCAHVTPDEDGAWKCKNPCEDYSEHLYIPPLLHSKPVNAGDGWVEYENFVNTAATGFCPSDKPMFASNELVNIGDKRHLQAAGDVKRVLGGGVVGDEN